MFFTCLFWARKYTFCRPFTASCCWPLFKFHYSGRFSERNRLTSSPLHPSCLDSVDDTKISLQIYMELTAWYCAVVSQTWRSGNYTIIMATMNNVLNTYLNNVFQFSGLYPLAKFPVISFNNLKVPLTPFCFKCFKNTQVFWAFLWKNCWIW